MTFPVFLSAIGASAHYFWVIAMLPVQVGLINDHVILVNASLGLYPELLQDR